MPDGHSDTCMKMRGVAPAISTTPVKFCTGFVVSGLPGHPRSRSFVRIRKNS
jgi:hypothetical protein